MAEDIQGLLNRIQNDGLRKAESEREQIIAEAKAEAEKIVAEAKAQAAALENRLRKTPPPCRNAPRSRSSRLRGIL